LVDLLEVYVTRGYDHVISMDDITSEFAVALAFFVEDVEGLTFEGTTKAADRGGFENDGFWAGGEEDWLGGGS
jgi:hypothetical protein